MSVKSATVVGFVALVAVGIARPAGARPCEFLPVACTYEASSFRLTVVDAGTLVPLADVHGLAEWRMVGAHGDDGPLMALDAVSRADGVLEFQTWGPVKGYRSGLAVGSDPVVSLFKSGYKAFIANNRSYPPVKETAKTRPIGQDGETIALQPFRGTPKEWLAELDRIWLGLAVPRSDETTLRFRDPYLNRLMRVSAERDRLPLPEEHRAGGFFWHVDRSLKLLQEGRR